MICVTIIFSENMEMMQRYSLLLQIVYAIKVTQKMYLKYIKKNDSGWFLENSKYFDETN